MNCGGIVRPATNAEPQTISGEPIVVKIGRSNAIRITGREVNQAAIRANLERENLLKPDASLIIAAHPGAETSALVTVLDAANLVGIQAISVATTEG